MGYQPFLIAPYKTGLDLDDDPWMAPQDAFTSITNGHIHHGVLEKRNGFTLLGYFTETPPAIPTPTINTINLSSGLPVEVVTNAPHALITGDQVVIWGVTGTTELNSGLWTITVTAVDTFTIDNTDGDNFTAYIAGGFVGLYVDERIMGIFRRIDDSGARELIVFNKTRAAEFDSTNETFVPLDTADIFTSGDEDFVWADNYNFSGSVQNRLYFTNGKRAAAGTDGLQFWDGSGTTTRFVPTFNTVNTLQGAKILFAIKNRLLLLSTLENGSDFPQRARWCQPQSDPTAANVWDDNVPGRGGFVDAPTGDLIVSARRIQNEIIVLMTNSVWRLRPNASPALPFVWEKINDFRSTQGRFATIGYDRYISAMGVRGITINSPTETQRADERIENFVTDQINANLFSRVYGARSYAVTRSWYLYSDQTDEDTDEVNSALIYDEGSGAWSIYKIGMNVLGYGNVTNDKRLSDFVPPNMDWILDPDLDPTGESDPVDDTTLRDYFNSGEEDIFLGGDRNGRIFVLEEGSSDFGTEIDFEVKSASWNFTKDQGTASQMGFLEFMVDTHPNTRFEVEFYKDQNANPYTRKVVTCLPTGNGFIGDVEDIENPLSTNISNITQADPAVVTVASTANFEDGDQILINGVTGMTQVNGNFYLVSNKTATTFELQALNGLDIDSTGFGAYGGSGTVNTLVKIRSSNHGLTEGDVVYIYEVDDININDRAITVTFYDLDDTINTFRASEIDGTNFNPYVGKGKIIEDRLTKQRIWKRVFAGGIGFQHSIRIINSSTDDHLRFHAFRPWVKSVGMRQIG